MACASRINVVVVAPFDLSSMRAPHNINFFSNDGNSLKRHHPDTTSTHKSTGKSTISAEIEQLLSELSLTSDDKYSIIFVVVAIAIVGFYVK